MSKLKNIREANIRLESRMLLEQTDTKEEIVYSIQQNPQTKKFRIFVTTPKFKTPTDAESVFGASTNWKDYASEQDAQKIIDAIKVATEKQKTQTQTTTPKQQTSTTQQQTTTTPQTDTSEKTYTGVPDSIYGG